MRSSSTKDFLGLRSIIPFQFVSRGKSVFILALWLVLVYTISSGAVRKWVTGPGQMSNVLLFGQLLMYFVFSIMVGRSRYSQGFRLPLVFYLYVIYLIFAALNPKNLTIYHGIFGFIIHFGFWIALISYYKIRDVFEIERIYGFLVILLLVEVAVAQAQYAVPAEHILNIKADGKAIDALVGSNVRVSGTFSYLGGFQVFMSFFGFMVWAMLVMESPFIFTVIVFGLSVYGVLMSGSRSATFLLLFVSLFSFVFTGFLFKRFINVLMVLGVMGLAFSFYGEKFAQSFETAYENFRERVEWGDDTGEQDNRVFEQYNEILNFKGNYPIYGIGLGSTYQGANAVFGESSYSKEFGYYENEATRIILEGGFILFLLRIILFVALLQYSCVPLLGKVVIFISFATSVMVFNTYNGLFLLVGIMLVDKAYYDKQTELRR